MHRFTWPSFSLTLLALAACSTDTTNPGGGGGGDAADADTDADSDADSDADGDTDADSDADTDTDPLLDSDSDGLTDVEENTLGTDPDDSDSDDDGFSDSAEVDAGTNPTYVYSHEYEGGYHVGYCDTPPVPTGPSSTNSGGFPLYQPGDVVENFTLPDHHNQQVDFYSFCGKTTLIAFGATWCGPCQDMAADAQDLQDMYVDEDLQMIEVLVDSTGNYRPTLSDVQGWASAFGLVDIPVLANDGSTYEPWANFEVDWGIPTTVVVGPDMTVLSVDQYVTNPGSFL